MNLIQAVSHQPLTAEARILSVNTCGGKSDGGTGLPASAALAFSTVYIILQVPHSGLYFNNNLIIWTNERNLEILKKWMVFQTIGKHWTK
jgi:hypothetical protein